MTVHEQAPAGEPRQEPGTFVLGIMMSPLSKSPGARRPDAADAVRVRAPIARHAVESAALLTPCSRSMATTCGRRCCRARAAAPARIGDGVDYQSRSSVRPDGARFITPWKA